MTFDSNVEVFRGSPDKHGNCALPGRVLERKALHLLLSPEGIKLTKYIFSGQILETMEDFRLLTALCASLEQIRAKKYRQLTHR
jgi:hypothetical protein